MAEGIMSLSVRRVLGVMVMAGSFVLALIAASNVSALRDMLALLITAVLVAAFLGLRLVAIWFRDSEEGAFESWGGMSETLDAVLARYRRPGGNPIMPSGVSRRPGQLPDADPTYRGHPVGRDGPSPSIFDGDTPPET